MVVTNIYRGFRYEITRAPDGKALLFVEGYRVPPRRVWPTVEEARKGLEHWADLELATGGRAP